MDSAPAFAMDKPFAPSAVRGPEPPENPQSRKNFSVSHLLDLEEVAAGMNGAPPGGPPPAGGAKAMPEPSGGSSGSEAAPQDGWRSCMVLLPLAPLDHGGCFLVAPVSARTRDGDRASRHPGCSEKPSCERKRFSQRSHLERKPPGQREPKAAGGKTDEDTGRGKLRACKRGCVRSRTHRPRPTRDAASQIEQGRRGTPRERPAAASTSLSLPIRDVLSISAMTAKELLLARV
ncbi:paired mesoderm homeobox protein 2 isoform X3 [Dromaius novaehollandiae]|uniref:paired mesoderm homeobox protein 2 isoform X3 n=1 Tax=Dromaius novaehollandiae TaxID=8790 RepID=UPI00311F891F